MESIMTSRERLMAILNREKKVDRVAWSSLIDGYFMSSFPPGKDIIDIFKEINADVMERNVFTWESNIMKWVLPRISDEGSESYIVERYVGDGVSVSKEETTDEKGTLLTLKYKTPGYTLTGRFLFTKGSPYISYPIEPLIKTIEDLEAYEYIKKKEKYIPNYSNFIKEDKRIGDTEIATDIGPESPIQTLITVLIGVEKFYTVFFVDYLDKLISLMDMMHEKNLECYEIIANSPADVVIDYENTSTTLVSPEIYKRYSLPCINDYADILHERNKIYLTHRCGKLKNLLVFLREGRDDGITEISPAPTGDLNIWDAWEALPNKIVMGGIDPTFLTQWSPEQIKEYVWVILMNVRGGERLIIGTADATPKDAKIENLKAVGECIIEEGELR